MRDIIVTSLVNGAIGSTGATLFIFAYYVMKEYLF